jgi:hypothetical protein
VSGDPDHAHNVVLCASWRPWRGYRLHEMCTRCDRAQALPGHWWRRSEMMRRYRRLQALAHDEQLRRIEALRAPTST